MSQHDTTVGGVGVVHVGDMCITITPLAQKDERVLMKKLRKAAERAAVADNPVERPAVKKLLAGLQSVPVAYLESIRELTRMAATSTLTDSQLWAFRESPEGVAIELYERGRAATPGLDAKALAACITEMNADEVFEEMVGIIAGASDPKETPSASPS